LPAGLDRDRALPDLVRVAAIRTTSLSLASDLAAPPVERA
jgi:hypothetical protein